MHELWADLIKQSNIQTKISEFSDVNFWLPIMAARKGLWTVQQCLTKSAVIDCLFNSESPFDLVSTSIPKCFAEEILDRFTVGDGTEDDRAVLAEVGKLARASGMGTLLVDRNWFTGSKLGDAVVRAYFLNTPQPEIHRHRYYGEQETDADVLLGAGVLLGIFAEAERWQLADLSEDQLADLLLGPLQVLDGCIIERCVNDPFLFSPPSHIDQHGRSKIVLGFESRFVAGVAM